MPTTEVVVEQLAVHPLALKTDTVIRLAPIGKRVVRSTRMDAGGLLAATKLVWIGVPFRVQITTIRSPFGSLTITEIVPVLPVEGAQFKVRGSGHVIVGGAPI